MHINYLCIYGSLYIYIYIYIVNSNLINFIFLNIFIKFVLNFFFLENSTYCNLYFENVYQSIMLITYNSYFLQQIHHINLQFLLYNFYYKLHQIIIFIVTQL